MYKIELGTIEDIQQIQELMSRKIQWLKQKGISQWQHKYTERYNYDYFKEQIDIGSQILVVRENEKITSFLMLCEKSTYFEDTTESYYVKHFTSESMLAGYKLLEAAYKTALNNGKKWLRGDCNRSLYKLVNYYKRFGAVICGEGESHGGRYKYYLLEKSVDEQSNILNSVNKVM